MEDCMVAFHEVEGVRIAYWMNDDGRADGRHTLVFVHGSGCDHSLWNCQYGAFADEYTLIGIDLPGHGQSAGSGEQEVDRYAEWVIKLMAGLGVQSPVIIGHSLGAAISLTCAIKYGSMLSGIVPVGGGVTMPVNQMIFDGIRNDPAATLAMIAKLSVAKENRDTFVPSIVDDMMRVDPEVIIGDFLSCDRLDLTDDIRAITVPTLLICGNDDKMTPPPLSHDMKNAIAGAELAVIENAGHFVMKENVDSFNGALKAFVDRLQR